MLRRKMRGVFRWVDINSGSSGIPWFPPVRLFGFTSACPRVPWFTLRTAITTERSENTEQDRKYKSIQFYLIKRSHTLRQEPVPDSHTISELDRRKQKQKKLPRRTFLQIPTRLNLLFLQK